ncbi:hypothetical protein A1F99_118360 [Pyrenophora tritici-repentis]|nr:hypothetical protein A1F99_118360 [Pyrenophora tritici-repentis]
MFLCSSGNSWFAILLSVEHCLLDTGYTKVHRNGENQ